ncbi:hypothetical protein HH214_08795 [Mucilaginibacter robiniae]|uniref:Uncharacterized protein n=1 Tax=Mucilaginibacter robiniae TaxID=2728022 RepID=A0A7L5E6E8_9SPHI|nr:hypothetical protein [Mucilaginibacter robiniae]QJD95966.1 hypothetical protein HH214_08795 [Mucilaginibacter robiniae]
MKTVQLPLLLSWSFLVVLSSVLIFVTNRHILTPQFYAASGQPLSGTPGREAEVYAHLQYRIYLLSITFLTLKTALIALVLYTALYLADHCVQYTQVLLMIIRAEYIFLLPALIKLWWFPIRYPHGLLTDWHHLYVLSLLSVCPDVPADWAYPLQTLNLWEILYCLALAWGVRRLSRLTYRRSLRLIACSYVPALLIWIVAVSFCTILFFPEHA